MKKSEARDFIKSELEKGVSKGEIIDTLLKQGRIGNSNATEELICELIEQVEKNGEDKEDETQLSSQETEKPLQTTKKGGANYEKWLVNINSSDDTVIEKFKKIKDVILTDEQASVLNAAKLTNVAKGTVIYYYKK
jgi:hypothetical protein